ncbi:MAG: TraB/GumN family protein [Flavobacteriales bacterium]|nr:TraB/GumN family protein [Flavobacteriales bacterium]MCB9198342.1 TraB/GumN family protein [Flavobacteriales bacterium]
MTRIVYLLLIVFFGVTSIAQTTQKSLAWQISGNGLKKTSYLYGTMHTQDQRVFEFKKGVLEALEASDVYVMEVNMDLMDQFSIMSMMVMDGDTTLDNLLSKTQYDSVSAYFSDSLGQSLKLFGSMMPILTAQTIELKDLGSDQELPLDLYFADLAKKNKKEVLGLETAEEQIKALKSVTYKDQAEYLYELVKGRYEGKEDGSIKELVELYIKGDLEGMLKLSSDDSMSSEKASEDFENNLIVKRNRIMTKRLIKIIQSQSAFIAVGAAHLGGKDGIITLLREMGFSVEPL